jgi:divalent metal cation (Fe/Co/Zn/Cd) transporter
MPAVPGTPDWLRLARLARLLSWLTLGWLGVEAGVAIAAAVIAGSVALLGFGLDSGIEALASIIVIWRFTGTRLTGSSAERRAQQLVAVSFFLLAPYIAVEAIWGLINGNRAETSIAGLVLTAGTAIFEPALGVVKRRIGARLPIRSAEHIIGGSISDSWKDLGAWGSGARDGVVPIGVACRLC